MREDVVAAERAKEVRDAERAWRSAGLTNDAVLARVVDLYPDDRHRFGPGFRRLPLRLSRRVLGHEDGTSPNRAG